MANKERPQARLFLAGDHAYAPSSSADQHAGESEQLEQEGAGQLPETSVSRFQQKRGETSEARNFHRHRALNVDSNLHRDSANIKISSITGPPASPAVASEKTRPPQESRVSKVPLRLQIKLCAQRGSLGLSIAGGKGSLPYRNHDEGIFISRVIQEGASEKAGIHVGDRLLEVNGLDMQGATHHEAVRALRNAGSWIRLTVLRDRLAPPEVPDPDGAQDEQGVTGRQPLKQTGQTAKAAPMGRTEGCLSKSIEALVCNGSDTPDQANETSQVLSKLTKVSLQDGKHTMGIPRIILTHPSTSDEDVEPLTQSPSTERQRDFDILDRCVFFDNTFYPH